MTKEARITKSEFLPFRCVLGDEEAACSGFGFRISGFFRHSSFGFDSAWLLRCNHFAAGLRTLMLIKCICTNCAGHLEFEEESAGETIECPHCHFETVLYLPDGTGAE